MAGVLDAVFLWSFLAAALSPTLDDSWFFFSFFDFSSDALEGKTLVRMDPQILVAQTQHPFVSVAVKHFYFPTAKSLSLQFHTHRTNLKPLSTRG
jgi:hypothetical protein